MLNIKQEPKLEWKILLGFAFVYIGFLIFLFGLQIIRINSSDLTQQLLTTLFNISIPLYIGSIIFGFVAILIQLFRWMTYVTTIPLWKRNEMKKGGKFK